MDTGIFRYSNLNVILVGILLVLFLTFPPVSAGLNVGAAKLLRDAAPGSVINFPIPISTDASDAPMDMLVDVLGFGQALDMGYTLLSPAQDTSAHSARPFITLDKTSVHISPGSTETVTAVISIPANAGPGGLYALISVHPGGQGQTIQSAYSIPIMITVAGQPVTETGSILGISSSGPVSVLTTFMNTGNHHYYNTVNSVTVKDTSGRTVGDVTGSPTLFAIIPGATVQYETMLRTVVPPGTYSVDSKVTLTDGTLLAERTATVTFAAPSQSVYAAATPASSQSFSTGAAGAAGSGGANIMLPGGTPAAGAEAAGGAPAAGSQGTGAAAVAAGAGSAGSSAVSYEKSSLKLTPKSQGVLESTNKQVSITFPSGSVIGDTDVTAQQVTAAQIPPAPSNVKPAVTCFQVNGLSGLLSKDATITVRYTQGDLDAAGGDASRLVLARWDEGDTTWTIMPTTVDTKALTLTVTTNRLSTWAVMVPAGPGPVKTTYAPGPGPLVVCGMLAALVIIAGAKVNKK